VQRLKALCPGMGRVKTAQTLARAGLHLGATTRVQFDVAFHAGRRHLPVVSIKRAA